MSGAASAVLLRGADLYDGDPVRHRRGDLHVVGGRIAEPAATRDLVLDVVDATGCVVLPGLVIAHHHLYSALARGMPGPAAAPGSFVEVLERVWWRLDRALDLELVELSARVGAAEAACAGVTTVVDHHASPDAIEGSLDAVARGLEAVGLRGVVCYETTDRHGEAGFEAGLAENARRLGRGATGRVRAMVGGHAGFTLSDDQLTRLADLARRSGAAVHLHVAEDRADVDDAVRRGARGVVERLERAGVLAGPALLAHGVHLRAEELEVLAHAGAFVTHQPRSNMNNHVGYAGGLRALGSRVALGTDGINGDLWDEAHAAFFRLREHDRHGAAETVWSWLAGGWRLANDVWGLEERVGYGALVPGAPADLVVLDYDGATPLGAASLPWHAVFGLSARHVRDVMVAGEWVVRDRRATRLDAGALRRDGEEGARRLWSRMAALPA